MYQDGGKEHLPFMQQQLINNKFKIIDFNNNLIPSLV